MFPRAKRDAAKAICGLVSPDNLPLIVGRVEALIKGPDFQLTVGTTTADRSQQHVQRRAHEKIECKARTVVRLRWIVMLIVNQFCGLVICFDPVRTYYFDLDLAGRVTDSDLVAVVIILHVKLQRLIGLTYNHALQIRVVTQQHALAARIFLLMLAYARL